MVSGADFYQALLESLWTGLEALPTEDFQWDASDRFTQARYLDPTRGGSRHLESWLTLGTANITPPHIVQDAELLIVHRYSPDDDSLSQARMHAAARAVVNWLQTWSGPGPVRARAVSYVPEALSAQWLATRITFELRLPRT
jgi:hypothetical protein